MAKGVHTASSPAAEQDEKLDEVDGQVNEAQAESSTANDDQSDSSPEREDQRGDADSAKVPTELDELRAKLTKAEPEAEAEDEDEDGDKPTETDSDDKEDGDGESEDATVDETNGDKSKGDDHADDDNEIGKDFLKKLPKEQRDEVGKHFARELKSRIEKKIERHPDLQAGRFLRTVQAKHGLEQEEVVASLALSAAYKAGDPRAVTALEAHADQLRAELQMPARGGDSVEPFKGALPPEFADMVSVLGMEEDDVRLMCASLKAHKEAPAKKQAQATRREERETQPTRRQPQVPVTVAGFRQDETAAADDAVADFLTSKGVDEKALKTVMGDLIPFMNKRAPLNPTTGKPDHRFIEPENRVKAVQIAHQRYVIDKANKLAETKRKAGPGTTGSAPPVRTGSSTSASKNPLAALRQKLVRR